MRKNVSKTTTKCNAIKVLSVALLAGLSVIGSNPASADSTYSTLNDALVDATTPRSYTVSQEGETLSQNQDTVAAGDLKISGVSSEKPSVLDASGKSIFNIANETNLILKDLDIKNALSNTNGAVLNITNSNATAEITNVNFSNNKISATGYNNYGGAIHNDGGHITTIAGNFTDNSLTNIQYGYGGVISNKSGTIDLIKGNFKNNYVTGAISSYDSQGGAIYNKGTINKIEGIFDSNSSQRVGGAIVNDGYIEEINAQFINNSAISTSIGYAGGGAISNGGTIDKISGLFKGNLVSKNAVHTNYVDVGGAAIENEGVINSITADFIENKIINEKTSASVYGGVIDNRTATIGDIKGDFKDNSAISGGEVYGGVITNWDDASIRRVTGDFTGNSSIASSRVVGGSILNSGEMNSIVGNLTNNYAKSGDGLNGGVIYNDGTIKNLQGNFSNNSSVSGSWLNGAIVSNHGTIESMSGIISNNYSKAGTYNYGTIFFNNGNIQDLNVSFLNNTGIGDGTYAMGVLTNYSGGNITSINGDFIGNILKSNTYASATGISNTGTIGNVVGNFISNSVTANTNVNGGVIYNNGTIKGINGNFANNSSIAGDSINGSVISNAGTIDSVLGVISNNYSKAGTLNYGTMLFNKGKINELNTSFLNNTSVAETYSAGTIVNYTNGNIGSIKGDFIGNKNCGVSGYAAAAGVNNRSTIGEIKGNFISNSTQSDSANAIAGAIWNQSGSIGSITGNFVNNSALAKTFAFGGALDNQGTIDSISGSFIGNSAKTSSDSQLAFGGAVYSLHTDLNFVADNTTNIFSGNYTEDSRGKLNNAIFVRTNKIASSTGEETFYNPTVTFNAKNNGQFVIDDTIDGGEINSDYTEVKRNHQYNIKLAGDKSGKITLNNNIYNANISQLSVTSFVNDASQLNYGNSLAMGSGVMNINHLGLSPLNLKNFSNSGTINLNSVDINPATETMGRITADSYGSQTGTINVNGLNVLADPNPDKLQTNVLFADSAFANTVKYNGAKEYVGKIYKYSVGYSPSSGEFQFVRGGGSSGGASAFNPSILNTSVNSQAGTNATVNETFKYVFEHADAFTQLSSVERFAKINENKYALSTDFNSNLPSISSEFNNKAGWFRPYVTFEKMNLRNASAVNATTYGSLVGFDSDFQTLKHGWTGVTTGYIGYTGSQLRYSGSDTTMNGGLLGLTQTFYKGNFWTALTATTGASAAQSTTMYGKEDFTTLFAGIGSKTGYNFEFKEGKYIVQPIWFMSYTMGKTFDYTNAAGVRIDSSPMHSIMLNPSVRFITNTRSGWQPYASVGMVWNAMSESNVKADGIRLPETSIKPYVEYGVGLQKRYKDDFIAFGQAMVRNGGRNGISLTAGFRWAIGKNKSNNPIEKVQKSNDKTVSMKKFLPPAVSFKLGLQDSSSRVQGERKVIKQLSETQRAKITKQYQNTTKTTYIGELRLL